MEYKINTDNRGSAALGIVMIWFVILVIGFLCGSIIAFEHEQWYWWIMGIPAAVVYGGLGISIITWFIKGTIDAIKLAKNKELF